MCYQSHCRYVELLCINMQIHFGSRFLTISLSKKIMVKRYLKAQILDDQVLVLLEKNTVHSLSSVFSSSSKLFVEANPDLLEVSCTQIQAPIRSSKSFSHNPNSTQFKYYKFPLPNSKVKFLKGSPSKTPLSINPTRRVSLFSTLLSGTSSEELEHLDRSTKLESQKRLSQ